MYCKFNLRACGRSSLSKNLTTLISGAQCKAVCVEAGMLALRRDSDIIGHEDFMEAIIEVQAKKKANLQYYA